MARRRKNGAEKGKGAKSGAEKEKWREEGKVARNYRDELKPTLGKMCECWLSILNDRTDVGRA